jgi:hypothetical protein
VTGHKLLLGDSLDRSSAKHVAAPKAGSLVR